MDRASAHKALDLPLDATPDSVRAVLAARRRRLEVQLEFARDPGLRSALRERLAELARIERAAITASAARTDRTWRAAGIAAAALIVAAIGYLFGAIDRVSDREPEPAGAYPVLRASAAPDRGTAERTEPVRGRGRAVAQECAVDRDPVTTVESYRRAARRGHALAMNDLGWAYHTGFGVARDHARAVEWFRRGAALGHPAAMNNLGVMLDRGQGVARDTSAAVAWFERAAAKKNATAMYHLALAYETGAGIALDLARAEAWYRRAAAAGDPDARAWVTGFDLTEKRSQ